MLYEMSPTQEPPEREFTLQKYLLLYSQHDDLQKHLNNITASLPPTASSPPQSSRRSRYPSLAPLSAPEDNRPSKAPVLALQHRQDQGGNILNIQHIQPPIITRSSLPGIISENTLREIEEDENKLRDVNEQIKCTLTNLLNCEGVKGDTRYRAWVQNKLMEAEKELTGSRYRSYERRSAGACGTCFSSFHAEGRGMKGN